MTINFKRIRQVRDEILSSIKVEHISTINDTAKKLQSLIEGCSSETAITLFNFEKKDFEVKYGIKNLIGYEDECFNEMSLNNDKTKILHLTYHEDILHKIRYDTIIYKLMSLYPLKEYEDYYEITFRLIDSKGSIIPVTRRCYLFGVENGKPKWHLDTWEKVYYADYDFFVSVKMRCTNSNLYKKFYDLNAKELGIHFTDTQKKVIALLIHPYSDKQIAEKLGKEKRTVQKHTENIRNEINEFINKKENSNLLSYIKNPNDLVCEIRYFVHYYGLYPFLKE